MNSHFKILLILFFLINSCKNEPKKITYARIDRDVPIQKRVDYTDGKLKLMITYQKGNLAGIEYYNTAGKWDSIVYYRRGKRNMVTRFIYNANGSSERLTYREDTFSLMQEFDKSHNLIYKEPVYINRNIHTKAILKSGKTEIDRKRGDTMLLMNNDLPPKNRGYKFIGFRPALIENSFPPAFKILPGMIKKGRSNVGIVVYLHEKNEHKELLDSILIPIK